jgi:hypothetical protein
VRPARLTRPPALGPARSLRRVVVALGSLLSTAPLLAQPVNGVRPVRPAKAAGVRSLSAVSGRAGALQPACPGGRWSVCLCGGVWRDA